MAKPEIAAHNLPSIVERPPWTPDAFSCTTNQTYDDTLKLHLHIDDAETAKFVFHDASTPQPGNLKGDRFDPRAFALTYRLQM